MTSIVFGGLFNAVAFAVAGTLFSNLNHRGYEKEMRRHNKATESLAKVKEKWYCYTLLRNARKRFTTRDF